MIKKYLFLLICILVALPIRGAESFEVDGVWYEPTSEYTAMVVEKPSSAEAGSSFVFRENYEGNVVIPETVYNGGQTYTVTAVKEGTFRQSRELTGVSLPATVTEVGAMPFAGCSNLAAITVAEGNPAFAVVDGLFCDISLSTLIACPGALATDIVVPSSVTYIAPSAFRGCSLKSVTIPQSVESIGACAFMNCTSLTMVSMTDGLDYIADSLFCNCRALTQCSFPTTVRKIGVSAFYHCDKLTSLDLPKALETIGVNAFNLCYGLVTVTFPASLKRIESWAFDNCTRIKTLQIPASVGYIDATAFSGCSALRSFQVAADNTAYCSDDGVLFDSEKKTLVCYPGAKTGVYTVPSSVRTLGNYSFYYTTQLKEIILPPALTTIGANTFRLCTALKRITLNSAVTAIGESAFRGCSSLGQIVCYATTPPEISSSTFTASNLNVPLYVLQRVIDDYKSAELWGQFATILPISADVVDGLLGDANNDGLINMTDVTAVINYILGKDTTDFHWQLVDMNFDGFINMTDVNAIINVILDVSQP